jgi:hypothetical protein
VAAAGLCLIQYGATEDCAGKGISTSLTAGTTYRLMLTNYYFNDFGPISLTVTQGAAYTPVVTTVSPVSGPTNGGTLITIMGTHFSSGATVSVGGVPATNVQVLNSTVITAQAPPHAPGTVNVSVTNGGTATNAGAFTYTPTGIIRAVRR